MLDLLLGQPSRVDVYNIIIKFFACCSALCGLLADAEGGTIFRFEDNTCTVATYRGPLGAYQDGEVGLYYTSFLTIGQGFILFLVLGTAQICFYD